MCQCLHKSYLETSVAKISDEEEGSVLYLVFRNSEDKNQDYVISLTKLKTIEYRLFRKIREKLRNTFSN
jgi:hypothetical protein